MGKDEDIWVFSDLSNGQAAFYKYVSEENSPSYIQFINTIDFYHFVSL